MKFIELSLGTHISSHAKEVTWVCNLAKCPKMFGENNGRKAVFVLSVNNIFHNNKCTILSTGQVQNEWLGRSSRASLILRGGRGYSTEFLVGVCRPIL